MDNIKLEICVDSVDSALTAQTAGADRVEFCNNLHEGGTTPSFGQIAIARKLLKIKLFVLIRPRGGDFFYNDIEFETMKSDLQLCGKLGCDGVVIGMLQTDGSIDKNRCKELVNIAKDYSMGVTFHRAFDRCCDLFQGLETIIDLGCERILTSGGKTNAPDGVETIRRLVTQAANRISIMAGAGITPENVAEIIRKTGVKEVHGTFKNCFSSKMIYKSPEFLPFKEEYHLTVADFDQIKKAEDILKNIQL